MGTTTLRHYEENLAREFPLGLEQARCPSCAGRTRTLETCHIPYVLFTDVTYDTSMQERQMFGHTHACTLLSMQELRGVPFVTSGYINFYRLTIPYTDKCQKGNDAHAMTRFRQLHRLLNDVTLRTTFLFVIENVRPQSQSRMFFDMRMYAYYNRNLQRYDGLPIIQDDVHYRFRARQFFRLLSSDDEIREALRSRKRTNVASMQALHDRAAMELASGQRQTTNVLPPQEFIDAVLAQVDSRFRTPLRAHQRATVAWMMGIERLARVHDYGALRMVDEHDQVQALFVTGASVGKALMVRRHGMYDVSCGLVNQSMGMGKTVEALAVMCANTAGDVVGERRPFDELKKRNNATLVVVPKTLVTQWTTEMDIHAPQLKYKVYYGSKRHEQKLDDVDVVVTTYETLVADGNSSFAKAKAASWKCGHVGVHMPLKVPRQEVRVDDVVEHGEPKRKGVVVATQPGLLVTTGEGAACEDVHGPVTVVATVRWCDAEHTPLVEQCPTCGSKRPHVPAQEIKRSQPLLQFFWHRIIFDEAHRLHTGTKIFSAAMKLVTHRRWALTGTVTSMYSLWYLLRGYEEIASDESTAWESIMAHATISHTRSLFMGDGEAEHITHLPALHDRTLAVTIPAEARQMLVQCLQPAVDLYARWQWRHGYLTIMSYVQDARAKATPHLLYDDGDAEVIDLTMDTEEDVPARDNEECPVCLEVLADMVKLPCCVHRMCAACLLVLLQTEHLTCAVCRAVIATEDAANMAKTLKPARAKKVKAMVRGVAMPEKLDALLAQIRSDPAPYVVVTQLDCTLQAVVHVLGEAGIACVSVTGSMTRPARDKAIRQFQKAGPNSTVVMAITMRTAGIGINLTNGRYVVIMEPCLNYALQTQAIGRVHRMGQRNEVTVIRMYYADTYEERVVNMPRRLNDESAVVAACLNVPTQAEGEVAARAEDAP